MNREKVTILRPYLDFPLFLDSGDATFGNAAQSNLNNRSDRSDRQRPLILVADDEPLIGETLVAILEDEGFDAVCVLDGASAIESAKDLKPDIFLADVSMPRLNGIEAAKEILNLSPKTRILLFSGQAETSELLSDARRAGYTFEVLAKPVNPITLLRKLRTSAAD